MLTWSLMTWGLLDTTPVPTAGPTDLQYSWQKRPESLLSKGTGFLGKK